MKYVINIQVRIPELDWDQRSFNPNQKKLRAYKQIQVFYLKIDIYFTEETISVHLFISLISVLCIQEVFSIFI